MTQTAVIHNKLKAALPTMVPGPRSPALKPLLTISMMERRISGAELPRAIKVRLATVSFQTRISTSSYPFASSSFATRMVLVLLVMVCRNLWEIECETVIFVYIYIIYIHYILIHFVQTDITYFPT